MDKWSVSEEECQKGDQDVGSKAWPTDGDEFRTFLLYSRQHCQPHQVPTNYSPKVPVHVNIRAKTEQYREKDQNSNGTTELRAHVTILAEGLPVDSHEAEVGAYDAKNYTWSPWTDGGGFVAEDGEDVALRLREIGTCDGGTEYDGEEEFGVVGFLESR